MKMMQQHVRQKTKSYPSGVEDEIVHLRVVVLFPHWVGCAREHGQLHPGHQGVVDGGVC